MFGYLQGAYITAVTEPQARVQRKDRIAIYVPNKTHTLCILDIFE